MKKQFPISIDHLYEMLEFVLIQVISVGFTTDAIAKIELAVEEALINIINHSGLDEKSEIEIECLEIAQGIKITIRDNGIPYNPLTNLKVIDQKTPLEERQLGGYGIYLIVMLMDNVVYHHEKNTNVLTLTKYYT